MPSIKITDLPLVAFSDVSDADTLLLIDAETLSSKQVTLSNLSSYSSAGVSNSIAIVNANLLSNVSSLNAGINTVNANLLSNVSSLNAGINAVNANLLSNVSSLNAGINIVSSNVTTLTTSVNTVNANVSSLASSINRAVDNIQAGTTYTLVLGDANLEIGLTNATSCAVSIPLNASVAFPIGTRIPVWADGTGIYSIVGVSGVTLNGVSGGTRTGIITVNTAGVRYAVILRKIGTDSWTVSGSIGAVV